MFSYTADVMIITIASVRCVSIAPLAMGLDHLLVIYLPLLLVLGVSAELFLLVTLPGVPVLSSLFLSFSDFFLFSLVFFPFFSLFFTHFLLLCFIWVLLDVFLDVFLQFLLLAFCFSKLFLHFIRQFIRFFVL